MGVVAFPVLVVPLWHSKRCAGRSGNQRHSTSRVERVAGGGVPNQDTALQVVRGFLGICNGFKIEEWVRSRYIHTCLVIKRAAASGAFAKGVWGVYGVDIDNIYKKAYKIMYFPPSRSFYVRAPMITRSVSFITQHHHHLRRRRLRYSVCLGCPSSIWGHGWRRERSRKWWYYSS